MEKEILNFLDKESNPIRVVEVPLLFEAKLDHYFDTIVVIDISSKEQKKRIESRDKDKAMYLLEINKTNKIDQNKNKATYLIDNSFDYKTFEKEILKTIKEAKDRLK